MKLKYLFECNSRPYIIFNYSGLWSKQFRSNHNLDFGHILNSPAILFSFRWSSNIFVHVLDLYDKENPMVFLDVCFLLSSWSKICVTPKLLTDSIRFLHTSLCRNRFNFLYVRSPGGNFFFCRLSWNFFLHVLDP